MNERRVDRSSPWFWFFASITAAVFLGICALGVYGTTEPTVVMP